MGNTVIPLRPASGRRSAISHLDLAAVELLIEGRAPNLRVAQIEATLTDLQTQRDRFAAVLADLRGQGPRGHVDTDAAEAALALTIAQGIIQIDALIARARAAMAADCPEPPAVPYPQTR